MRVIFMGTPDFAVPTLKALIRAPEVEVVAVFSQPDKPQGRGLNLQPTPVKACAVEAGIPVFQPEKLNQPDVMAEFKKLAPDFLVVVAYGKILKKELLDLPTHGCVNVHASLLPRWRGAAPLQWSILAGDTTTGITTMEMVEALDAGRMYLKKEIPILETTTVSEIHDTLSQMGGELIVPTLLGIKDGTLNGDSQDESKVTYASKLTKDMEALDPRLNALELSRRVRALNPWPGTSLKLEGLGKLKVKEAVAHPRLEAKPGHLSAQAGMLLIGTSQGALELKRVQLEGKKEMSVSDLLNGFKGSGRTLPIKLETLA